MQTEKAVRAMISVVAAGALRYHNTSTILAGEGFVARMCLVIVLVIKLSLVFSVQL
jgi:hypothetical protein